MADVLLISGGSRKGSKTTRIAKALENTFAAEGGKLRVVNPMHLPLFTGYSYEDSEQEAIHNFRALVAAHKTFIFASPEYHGAMSAVLKNAVDHLPERCLRGKLVGMVAVAGGAVSPVATVQQLRGVARNLGALILPCELFVTRSKTIFGEDGSLQDAKLQEKMDTFVRELLALSAQLHQDAFTPQPELLAI